MCSPAHVVHISQDHLQYICRYFSEPDVRELQTIYDTEGRNRQKTEDGEIDNTGHKSMSSGTAKQRVMGSYSGSASYIRGCSREKGRRESW